MSNRNLRLFAISFVMLFLEIFLIRWISTELRIFAYVSNLLLLACFLGIGIGCYLSKKNANVLITIGLLAIISLGVRSQPFQKITDMLSGFSDSVIWYESINANTFLQALNGTALTLIVFSMVLTAFIPLGQILGNLLDGHRNIIVGYSINIFAGLLGIWTFNIFSFLYTKPWVWFAFSLIILLFFIPRRKMEMLMAITISSLTLLIIHLPSDSISTVWSPYQRLDIYPNIHFGIQNGYIINVNKVGYMSLLNLSQNFINRYPKLYDIDQRKYNQYELPYQFAENRDSVLIVGAGAGNDAAGALHSGLKKIDAVEIDPGIYRLGLELHPERPYQNKRINVIIDDARAFFKKTKRRYDVITFGLLDSHTLSSNYNNIRLDNYVYTKESFQDAKNILKANGLIAIIFEVKRRWIGERIYGLLKNVFGEVPYVFEVRSPHLSYGWGGIMFITGKNLNRLKEYVETKTDLKDFIDKNSINFTGEARMTTDNWPYLYIEKVHIPRMYLLIITPLLALLIFANRFLMARHRFRIDMHFFFLGCAFLLLEFQNISKSTLLFGSTWVVNSYVISAILILILLSNLFVYYVNPVPQETKGVKPWCGMKIKKIRFFYILLLASVILLYLIPVDIFNIFGYWNKLILSIILLNLPIFFAGIIFIISFKNAASKTVAFGSNLLGAAVGGILETFSFMAGIRSLLVIVFLSYVASFLYLKYTSD